MKKISIVGIGMGNGETITIEGRREIDEADILIGAARMIESCGDINKPYYITVRSSEIAAYIEEHDYEKVCVLVSGDVGFYSGTKKLIPLLENHQVKLYPGVSSLSYFCARLGMSWEHVYPVSVHGRVQNLIPAVASNEKTFALTDGNISEICKNLIEANLGYVQIYVGEYLSYENERITKGIPAELIDKEFDALSVLMIVNKQYGAGTMTGISDDAFIRGKVPMTKSEVRAVIISKLRLKNDGVAYDIGAGTGSVSIEMALNAPNGKIYAVEFKEEAVRLIEKNKAKFCTENLTIVEGIAPGALEHLPAPDTVFIGGSKGQMSDIFTFLKEKMKDRVRIVISAIALETVSEVCSLVKEFEVSDLEVVQVGISKAKEIGSYHLMEGQNPVFIISGYLHS